MEARDLIERLEQVEFGLFVLSGDGVLVEGETSACTRLLGEQACGRRLSDLGAFNEDGSLVVAGRTLDLRALGQVEGGALWSVVDVSERVSAQRRAREAEELLRSIRTALQTARSTARFDHTTELSDGDVMEAVSLVEAPRAPDLQEDAPDEWKSVADEVPELAIPVPVEAPRVFADAETFRPAPGLEMQSSWGDGAASAESATISKEDLPGPRWTDVVAPLRDLANSVARARGIRMEVEVVGSDTELDWERAKAVSEALPTLIENAVIHGSDPEAKRGKLRIRFEEADEAVSVTVEDEGRGLDVETLAERVVERQILTVSQLQGLQRHERMALAFVEGVGARSGHQGSLAGVRRALKAYRGEVMVRSVDGGGTSVSLTVPRPHSPSANCSS